LAKWFMAMYLMAEDKRGISALALKGRIGVACQTAWAMCHKIRHAMGSRDAGYKMGGVLEMDEGFFGSPTEGGKRGRGSEKTPVLVSVSRSGGGKPGRARMKVVEKVTSKAVMEFSEAAAAKGSEVRTDGLHAYRRLAKGGYVLNQRKVGSKDESGHLHWAHVVISNAKAFIGGTFHGLAARHLQRYLDEFCYRFNRRFFPEGIFPRLLNACLSADKITFDELIG
jgi:hypothetical protein